MGPSYRVGSGRELCLHTLRGDSARRLPPEPAGADAWAAAADGAWAGLGRGGRLDGAARIRHAHCVRAIALGRLRPYAPGAHAVLRPDQLDAADLPATLGRLELRACAISAFADLEIPNSAAAVREIRAR